MSEDGAEEEELSPDRAQALADIGNRLETIKVCMHQVFCGDHQGVHASSVLWRPSWCACIKCFVESVESIMAVSRGCCAGSSQACMAVFQGLVNISHDHRHFMVNINLNSVDTDACGWMLVMPGHMWCLLSHSLCSFVISLTVLTCCLSG